MKNILNDVSLLSLLYTYFINSEKIAGKSQLGQAVKSSFTKWRPYKIISNISPTLLYHCLWIL